MKNLSNKVVLLIAIILSFGLFQPMLVEAAIQEPVILVPGILGSWNWSILLNKNQPESWHFLEIDHTWDNMIDALEKAGYVKDKTLFIAFYDWRQSNINSATDYLVPTIDKALANSDTGKVNIIAHSMGGLVARRYIQSSNYRDDVDQLVLLGTPSHGSSDIYTLWEGGRIPNNWDSSERLGLSLILRITTKFSVDTGDYYDTIHTFIPSVGELLPTYDYLVDADENTKNYYDLFEARNPFLENLNSVGTQNLQTLGGITVIAGKGESTVGNITVAEQADTSSKLWKDGVPNPINPVRNNVGGDNRVLLDSVDIKSVVYPPVIIGNFWQRLIAHLAPRVYASIDLDPGASGHILKQVEIDSKHGDLPTNAITNVFTVLGLDEPPITYTPPPEPDGITSFWVASPVTLTVTDPQGRVTSKDSTQIPGAIYTGESDPDGVKMIIIPNALSGQYKVSLAGTANGSYHMAVADFTDTGDKTVTTEKSVSLGEQVEYTANINNNLPEPTVELSAPIAPPVLGHEDEDESDEDERDDREVEDGDEHDDLHESKHAISRKHESSVESTKPSGHSKPEDERRKSDRASATLATTTKKERSDRSNAASAHESVKEKSGEVLKTLWSWIKNKW